MQEKNNIPDKKTILSWWQRWLIPLSLFLVAFLPRAIYPVSRPGQWYIRAIDFTDAILARDWAATYLQYHPGVTTMWLSGIALKLYGWRYGFSSEQLSDYEPNAVAVGVLPLALVVALCIVLVYFMLIRLTNFRIAVAASFLMALNPFHITQSKVLHVDALVSILMILGALFLLRFYKERTRSSLIISGIFSGLAFLTKSPSMVLIPFTFFLICGIYLREWRTAVHAQNETGQWWTWVRLAIRDLFIWGIVVTIIYIGLWPAMWVEPHLVVWRILENAFFHAETAHKNPVYFNGINYLEDPGIRFYIATLIWRTTLVTLPLIVVGLVVVITDWKEKTLPSRRLLLWFLFYLILFMIEMGLSAKKSQRYILPAFPALDVFAAVGLVQMAGWIGRYFQNRVHRLVPIGLISAAIVLQGLIVLPHHPYYGTHFNQLLGGPEQAQKVLVLQAQNEGVDLVVDYLNSLPNADQITITMHPSGTNYFERDFVGRILESEERPNPQADYRLYHLNQIMRSQGGEEWQQAWLADEQREPIWTAEFDGIIYVWVFDNVDQ